MFEIVSPESIGIPSRNVEQFLHHLNDHGLATHSVMMLKGDKVFCKAYWKPFTDETLHRMYSQTKSFVGIAVCHLISQGKIGLHDNIVDYFKDCLPAKVPAGLKCQTVEDMLTMKTCMEGNYWFDENVTDRVEYYFHCTPKKMPNTRYDYDSDASFVLSVLVERVTGQRVLDYLREICLDEIGFSKDAKMLSCAGGYPWGDSGLICRTEDICRFARLLANGGVWNGKQLLDRKMVAMATECHTDTSVETYPYGKCGYGYQIWKNPTGGFSFLGMHGQYMHYDAKTDIIFTCTSGNKPGNSGQIIFDGLERFIFGAKAEPLPEKPEEYLKLKTAISNLSLLSLHGTEHSGVEKEIQGKKYSLSDNPMEIEWITFNFSDTVVRIDYQNRQGIKKIVCGRNGNCLQRFPQTGYSRSVGGLCSPGNTYECAASATWQANNVLVCKIQIVDEYIGILDMRFEFEKKSLIITMEKSAENFLKEYDGKAVGNMV